MMQMTLHASLIATVGARGEVTLVTLVVAAVVSAVISSPHREHRQTFSKSSYTRGSWGRALHNSATTRPHLLVNVLIQRPLALRVAHRGTLLPWLGIRGIWMLGNELAPQVSCPSVVMAYVIGV